MEIVFGLLFYILTLASMIGLFLSILGVPSGIVLAILKSLKKVKITTKMLLFIIFGGPALLIASFFLFFIVNVIASFFGMPLNSIKLPND